MIVLGIETSCDETAAAVVRNGRDVLSSIVYSQIELHGPYGGVVPEIACRCHVEVLPGVIDEALRDAAVGWDDLDGIAVTYGPGLASSLLVGLSSAKALSMRTGTPLCGINHLQAHIFSAFMGPDAPVMSEAGPFVALVVSGGHTCLVKVAADGSRTLLGQTIDDAAGEAFDKGAILMDLGYPGGPIVDKLAKEGNATAVRFPRGRAKRERGLIDGMDSDLCFTFSGLKTALLYHLKSNPVEPDSQALKDVVASYQEAIIDALATRCRKAIRDVGILAVGGGVSLNSALRARLAKVAADSGVSLLLAEPRLCGDNAAMIAGLASSGAGIWGDPAMALDAEPNLPICDAGDG